MRSFLQMICMCFPLLAGPMQATDWDPQTLREWRNNVDTVLNSGNKATKTKLFNIAWPGVREPHPSWRTAFADAFALHWATQTTSSPSMGCFGFSPPRDVEFEDKTTIKNLKKHDLVGLLQKRLINPQSTPAKKNQAIRILGSYCRPETEDVDRYQEFISILLDMVLTKDEGFSDDALHALRIQLDCDRDEFKTSDFILDQVKSLEQSGKHLTIFDLSTITGNQAIGRDMILARLEKDFTQAAGAFAVLKALPNNELWFNEMVLGANLKNKMQPILDTPITKMKDQEDRVVRTLITLSGALHGLQFYKLEKELVEDRRFQQRIPFVSPEVRLMMLKAFMYKDSHDFDLETEELFALLKLRDELDKNVVFTHLFARPLDKVEPAKMLELGDSDTSSPRTLLSYIYGINHRNHNKRDDFLNALIKKPHVAWRWAISKFSNDYLTALLQMASGFEDPELLVEIFPPFLNNQPDIAIFRKVASRATKSSRLGRLLANVRDDENESAAATASLWYDDLADGPEERFVKELTSAGELRKLGEGRFGQVYLAYDRELKVNCALKEVKHREPSEDASEGEILAMFPPHPNIVQLLAHGHDQVWNIDYLAMEVCSQSLRSYGRLSENAIKPMVIGLVAALKFLRSQQIAHRDIKEDNVLFKGDVIKLADFGLAVKCKKPRTDRLAIEASVTHVAPEAISGPCHDTRYDLWSLALMICNMVMGNYPVSKFSADKKDIYPEEIWPAERFPAELSDDFKRFVLALLKKDPAERLGSDDIEALLRHSYLSL